MQPKPLPRRLITVLVLALAFPPVIMGSMTPVQVLPGMSAATYTFSMDVKWPPDTLCAGQSYPVRVRASAHLQGDLNGKQVDLTSEGVNGLKVFATVVDPSVILSNPSNTTSGPAGGDEPGGANFLLEAKKAGTTRVYFQATVEHLPGKNSPKGRQIEAGRAFKVVNCKFKVTVMQRGRWGVVVSVGTSGFLKTTITGEQSELSGSGTLNLTTRFSFPGCGSVMSITPVATTIKGSVSESGQLDITLDYVPSDTNSGTVNCPMAPTVSGGGTKATSELLGITKASFPAEGGTRKFPFPCMNGGSCTMYITAKPVK